MPKMTVGHEGGSPITVHYEDIGTGPVIVLIPGWTLTTRSWEHQIPALVHAGHRVITYDRRGSGQSSKPWHGHDYTTLTSDLAALLTHLHVEDATVVGFSMGGGELARLLAGPATFRVRRAVFASSITPYLPISVDNPDGGYPPQALDEIAQAVIDDRVGFLDQFHTEIYRAGDQILASDAYRAYSRDLALQAHPQAVLENARAWSTADFRDDLAAARVPALILHGGADANMPFECSGRRTAALLPDARCIVIPDAPHMAPVTHSIAFNKALLEFIGAT